MHDSFTFSFRHEKRAAIGSIHVILKQFVSFVLMHNLNHSAKLIKAASLQDSKCVYAVNLVSIIHTLPLVICLSAITLPPLPKVTSW